MLDLRTLLSVDKVVGRHLEAAATTFSDARMAASDVSLARDRFERGPIFVLSANTFARKQLSVSFPTF
jgi:hypothetical protein